MFTLLTIAGLVAGIVACLLYRRQAPQPLTIAAIALAGLLAITMLESVAEPIFYRTLGPQQQGGLLVSNALGALKLLGTMVRLGAIAGLLVAVVTDRKIDFQKIG
jgi:hypothetical protein